MSIDGCLVEFTRPEPLSAENGWKCPNCASEFVHGSDNLEKKTAREYSVPVHDSSAQGVSCSHAEDHSDKNVLGILVAEDSAEITGINQTERPASTSSGQEDDRKSVNLEHQKFRSSGEGHRLKRRKSQIIEHEAKSKAIIQEATKRYLISEAPPVLTIHLKRFKRNFFGDLSKLSGHVAFQEKLDLRPYLDPRCQDKDNCIYQLIGLVRHGGTMVLGHYDAYVRYGQDGSVIQWFHISDSFVKEVSLRDVLRSEAYILFYEKCKF